MKNIIKFTSVLLATAIFISSCNQHRYTEEVCKLDVIQLENVHQTVKNNIEIAKTDFLAIETKSVIADDLELEFSENLQFLNNFGLEALFEQKGLNVDIISEVEFLVANQNSVTVYQDLIDHFNIENEEEAAMLFTIFETQKLIMQNLSTVSKSTNLEMKRISLGCALAIAATVSVTAGAAFVTGGASLIVFLVGKGIATAAIIEACI